MAERPYKVKCPGVAGTRAYGSIQSATIEARLLAYGHQGRKVTVNGPDVDGTIQHIGWAFVFNGQWPPTGKEGKR